MKLTNREKVLLPLLLIFVLSFLFINFVYFPISKSNKELLVQSLELGSKISEVEAKQAQLETLKQQIGDLSGKIENDNKDLLKKWDQTVLLVALEQIIANASDQKSIDFYDIIPNDTIQSGEIDLVFNTNYNNLQNILTRLEKSEYFNTISSFSITKIKTVGDGTSLKYDLEVTIKLNFYTISVQEEYTNDYDFMRGSFGKTNIFQ